MSEQTEILIDEIRGLIGGDTGITEKRMFGGLCFMLNGHMMCGPTNTGDLMVRVGKDAGPRLLEEEDAREMDFTGRVMKGYLFVTPENEERLFWWISRAREFVSTLPPKQPKPAKTKKEKK